MPGSISVEYLDANLPDQIHLFRVKIQHRRFNALSVKQATNHRAVPANSRDNHRIAGLIDLVGRTLAQPAGEAGLDPEFIDSEQKRRRHHRQRYDGN